MVEVTYYCPSCGALTSLERDAYMADKSVTKAPLPEYEYASTTDDDLEDADGVELVCLGNADDDQNGCGRVFYLNFVKFEEGRELDHGISLEEEPNFDFLR